jgi:uncharacterized protein (TIGR00730 family)
MSRIAVFCGSKEGNDKQFAHAAHQLGVELAKRKIELVYGGGGIGLMGIVANAALDNGGKVIGVIPEKLYEMEVAHMGLTELYRVKTMHERKALMADLSDAFIAMPGGIGTLEEITEVMTWAQIGYHNKPCAFLNVSAYFDDFFSFFDHMEKKGFLYSTLSEQVIIDHDPKLLLDRLWS